LSASAPNGAAGWKGAVAVAAEDGDKDEAAEKPADKQAKKGKQGKQGKGKQGKSSGAKTTGGEGGSRSLSLAGHPRAVRRVAEAKAWGGLGGFLLGGYMSLPTHSPSEAALRALLAGVVCYVVVWAAAVFVWRRLLVAELRHAQHELLSRELAKLEGADPSAPVTAERRGAPVAR